MFRKSGFLSRVFKLSLPGAAADAERQEIPVLPKQIYVDFGTDKVEAVSFLRCPPEARVRVEVPLRLLGVDACAGVRKGGTVNQMRRKVLCWCPGDGVPSGLDLDISRLEIGQKVLHSQLQLPPGVQLAMKDASLAVLKISGRTPSRGGEEAEPAGGGGAPAKAAAPAAK